MDAVGTPWKRHGLPRRLHYDLTARPRDSSRFFLGDGAGLISTWGDSVGGGTSSVFFGLFPLVTAFLLPLLPVMLSS